MAKRIITAREQYELAEPFLRTAAPEWEQELLESNGGVPPEEISPEAPEPVTPEPVDPGPQHFHPEFLSWMDNGKGGGGLSHAPWEDYHASPSNANDWHKAWQEETGNTENPIQDQDFVNWMNDKSVDFPGSWKDYHTTNQAPKDYHELYQEENAPLPQKYEKAPLMGLLQAYNTGEITHAQGTKAVNTWLTKNPGIVKDMLNPQGIETLKGMINNEALYNDFVDLLDKGNHAKLTDNGKHDPYGGDGFTAKDLEGLPDLEQMGDEGKSQLSGFDAEALAKSLGSIFKIDPAEMKHNGIKWKDMTAEQAKDQLQDLQNIYTDVPELDNLYEQHFGGGSSFADKVQNAFGPAGFNVKTQDQFFQDHVPGYKSDEYNWEGDDHSAQTHKDLLGDTFIENMDTVKSSGFKDWWKDLGVEVQQHYLENPHKAVEDYEGTDPNTTSHHDLADWEKDLLNISNIPDWAMGNMSVSPKILTYLKGQALTVLPKGVTFNPGDPDHVAALNNIDSDGWEGIKKKYKYHTGESLDEPKTQAQEKSIVPSYDELLAMGLNSGMAKSISEYSHGDYQWAYNKIKKLWENGDQINPNNSWLKIVKHQEEKKAQEIDPEQPTLAWMKQHFPGSKNWTQHELTNWYKAHKDKTDGFGNGNLPGALQKWVDDFYGDKALHQGKPDAKLYHDYSAMGELAQKMGEDWYTDSPDWKLWAHSVGPGMMRKYLNDPGLASNDFSYHQGSSSLMDDFKNWYNSKDHSNSVEDALSMDPEWLGTYYNEFYKDTHGLKGIKPASSSPSGIPGAGNQQSHVDLVTSPEFKEWFKKDNNADLDDPFYKGPAEMLQDSHNPWTMGKLIQYKYNQEKQGNKFDFGDYYTAYGQKMNDPKFYHWINSVNPAEHKFYAEYPQYALQHFEESQNPQSQNTQESQAPVLESLKIPEAQGVPEYLIGDDGGLKPGVFNMIWDKYGKHSDPEAQKWINMISGTGSGAMKWTKGDWGIVGDDWKSLGDDKRQHYINSPLPEKFQGIFGAGNATAASGVQAPGNFGFFQPSYKQMIAGGIDPSHAFAFANKDPEQFHESYQKVKKNLDHWAGEPWGKLVNLIDNYHSANPPVPASPLAPKDLVTEKTGQLKPDFQEWLWKKRDKSMSDDQFLDAVKGWGLDHWNAAAAAFREDQKSDPNAIAHQIANELIKDWGWHDSSYGIKKILGDPEGIKDYLQNQINAGSTFMKELYDRYFGSGEKAAEKPKGTPGEQVSSGTSPEHQGLADTMEDSHGWVVNDYDYLNWAKQFTPDQAAWLNNHSDVASKNFEKWVNNFHWPTKSLKGDHFYELPDGLPEPHTDVDDINNQPEGWLDYSSDNWPTFIQQDYNGFSPEQNSYSDWLKNQSDDDIKFWAKHPDFAKKSWEFFHNNGAKVPASSFNASAVAKTGQGLTNQILKKHIPDIEDFAIQDWMSMNPEKQKESLEEHIEYLESKISDDWTDKTYNKALDQWKNIYDEAFGGGASAPEKVKSAFDPGNFYADYKDAFPNSILDARELDTPQKAENYLVDIMSNDFAGDSFKNKAADLYSKWFEEDHGAAIPGLDTSIDLGDLPPAPQSWRESLNDLMHKIRLPHTIFTPEDASVVQSPAFQHWFSQAPESYRAVAKEFPIIPLEDFKTGDYSKVPELEEGESPTQYQLLHDLGQGSGRGGYFTNMSGQPDRMPGEWGRHAPGHTRNPQAPKSHGRPDVEFPPKGPDVPNQLELPLPGGSSWEPEIKYPTMRRGIYVNFNRYKPGGKHHHLLELRGEEGAKHRRAAQILDELRDLVWGTKDWRDDHEPPRTLFDVEGDLPDGDNEMPEIGKRPGPDEWMKLFAWGQKNNLTPQQMYTLAKKVRADDPDQFGTPPLSYFIAQQKRDPAPMARRIGEMLGDPDFAKDFQERDGSLGEISHKLQSIADNNDWPREHDAKTQQYAKHLYEKWFGQGFLNDLIAQKILDYVETGGWKPGEFQDHPVPGGMGPHWTKKDYVDFGDESPGPSGFPVQVVVDWLGHGEDEDSKHGAQGFQSEEEITKNPGTPLRVKQVLMRHPHNPNGGWIDLDVKPHLRYARVEPVKIPARKQGRSVLSHQERFARDDDWDDWDDLENPMDSGEPVELAKPKMTTEDYWRHHHRTQPDGRILFPNDKLNPPSNAESRPDIQWQDRDPDHLMLDDSMPKDRVPQSLFRGLAVNLKDPAAAELHRLVFGHHPDDEHLFDMEHAPANWDHPELGHALLDHLENNRPPGDGPHPIYGLGPHWSLDPSEANGFAMSEAHSGTRDPNGLYLPVRLHGDWKGLGEDPYRSGTGEAFHGQFADENEMTLLPGAGMNIRDVQIRPPGNRLWQDWRSVLDTPQFRHAGVAPISQAPRTAKRIISQREWLEG